jgi:nucleoside diphosphate kinase
MQQLIGSKDPHEATKDSLRSFYGTDRFDNAYFVSETLAESLIERDYLFIRDEQSLFGEGSQRVIKAKNPA